MPAASEVKKIDQSWESKVTDISTGNLWGDLEQINRAILDCNEAVTDAGLGGISYVSQNSEIQRRMNAIGIMEEYVMGIRSALQQQLDDPLFDGFNKKATETLSRIHPEKFETANTLGLTVTLGASGHGESYSSKETKDHLDLYDFLGYTVGNYSEYGCLHTESMECVQDFADMFKADYDAVSKSGALKGSSVKSLDDYLKNLVSGGDFSHHMDQPFKSFLSGLLDITIVKPIIDACTGYDCVTGEDLSNTEQSLDLLFAAVSLIPFAGVAGKAIDIGGKKGAPFLGKRVAVDCVSYATSYSAGKLAEQKGLDPRANILISLGIGLITTKGVAKLVFKDGKEAVLQDAKGAVLPDLQEPTVSNTENFDRLVEKAKSVDVSTGANQAVFYSGEGNRAGAEAFAKLNGKMTLEMTPGGKYFDNFDLFGRNSPLTDDQALKIWSILSERYAKAVSANVCGFVQGARAGSIFNTVEYPTLQKNPYVTNILTELFN